MVDIGGLIWTKRCLTVWHLVHALPSEYLRDAQRCIGWACDLYKELGSRWGQTRPWCPWAGKWLHKHTVEMASEQSSRDWSLPLPAIHTHKNIISWWDSHAMKWKLKPRRSYERKRQWRATSLIVRKHQILMLINLNYTIMVSWCSWLSRQSNTLKVSGSSPGDATFFCPISSQKYRICI